MHMLPFHSKLDRSTLYQSLNYFQDRYDWSLITFIKDHMEGQSICELILAIFNEDGEYIKS